MRNSPYCNGTPISGPPALPLSDNSIMTRPARRRVALGRPELLEVRALLSTANPYGMWPLRNPSPETSLLVRFDDRSTPSDVSDALVGLGGYVESSHAGGPSRVALGPRADRDEALRALRADPHVLYAEPDAILEAAATTPNDPQFGSEWGLDNVSDVDLDAPQAWETTTGSAGTLVAVTDTGIDYTHPDLYLGVALNSGEIPGSVKAGLIDTNGDGRLDFYDLNSLDASGRGVLDPTGRPVNAGASRDLNGNGRIDARDLLADPAWADGIDGDRNGKVDDLVGWNGVASTSDAGDDNGHGTHVSGTIAARSDNGVGVAGVNWKARILPLKFLDASGSGSTSAAVNLIYYAADSGAKVINASWGGAGYSQSLSDAIQYAGSKGAVFVAAAGNSGTDDDASPFYPASYPLANIVSVAAVDSAGGLAGFSNYGKTSVDVAAPGVDILSTTLGGGYGWLSGTSMAAPHVSGVLSLLAGQHPEYTAQQLVTRVKTTTRPLPSLSGKVATGGMVNAALALTQAATNRPPTATDDAVSTTAGLGVRVAVLANDSDPDLDPLTVTSVTQGAHGAATINGDGTVTYAPAAGYQGPDLFTYVIGDGRGGSATATVTVTVSPPAPDAAPILASPAMASSSTVTGTFVTLGVLGSDDGGEAGLTYTWSVVASPAGAHPAFSANGTNAAKSTTVTFDTAGTYRFLATTKDAGGQSVTSSVDVTVAWSVKGPSAKSQKGKGKP